MIQLAFHRVSTRLFKFRCLLSRNRLALPPSLTSQTLHYQAHLLAIPEKSSSFLMASSEVDQKFLGRLAKTVEKDNPLLASILFKILGLSLNLSSHLIKARKQRRLDATKGTQSLDLCFNIIWLAREGLLLLEQYVIPMVGQYVELKVLAYKLRASFYHIFVLFHNQPPVPEPARVDKGKGIARDDDLETDQSRFQDTASTRHVTEGGPVGPPPGFGPEPASAFLLPAADYLPVAHRYFREAVELAEKLLWGSHSLRLSVKTEYAAFLYDCVHDGEASRKLAKDTIAEVYEATEGIDTDMFTDACELVAVLGKMMKRGLGSSNTLRSGGKGSSSGTQGTQGTPSADKATGDKAEVPPGMI